MSYANLQTNLLSILGVAEDTFDLVKQLLHGEEPEDELSQVYLRGYDDTLVETEDDVSTLDYTSLPDYSVTQSYLQSFSSVVPSLMDTEQPMQLYASADTVMNNLNRDLDVCGYDRYVKPTHIRMDNPDQDPCGDCMGVSQLEQYYSPGIDANGDNIAAELSSRYVSDGGDWPDELPSLDQYTKQCHFDPFVWVPAQTDHNPYLTQNSNPNWTQIQTILEPDYSGNETLSTREIDLVEKWYLERMTRAELLSNMNSLDYRTDIDDEDERLRLFQIDISRDKGASITCTEPINGVAELNDITVRNISPTYACDPSGHFGPRNVIYEEYQQWSESYLQNPPQTISETQLATLGSQLLPINPGFEGCINTLLQDVSGRDELSTIEEIHAMESILDLTQSHLQFIRRKLELLLIESHRGSIISCIDQHIYVDTTICQAGLTEQLLLLLNILFSTLGISINMEQLDANNQDEKDKLIEIIDTLGDLIPRCLQSILTMSEHLEIDTCGSVSNKTRLLQELYNQMFQSNTHVNLDFGLGDLISEETTNDKEFRRSTILGALSLAFLKFL